MSKTYMTRDNTRELLRIKNITPENVTLNLN